FYSYQRIFEFPLGFVAYRMWKHGVRIRPMLAAVIAIAAYAWMSYVNWNALSDANLLSFGIPAFLVVACCLNLESSIGSGPLTGLAILIGDASYAIYLSHPYCVEAARRLMTGDSMGVSPTGPLGVTAIIIVATGVGIALYWYVDRPLHKNARRLLQ